jgi:hypothetical protein
MSDEPALARSAALWNRSGLDLRSDETLTQLLDRGEMDAWRALYRLAADDPSLRARIARIVREVPLPLPRFWLAALKSLGEDVDLAVPLPPYERDAEW